MTKSPKFSLIILSYNTKKLLADCLDSIYKYSKNVSFEVVVIDHNSQDGSVEFLKKYQKQKKNFKAIFKKDNPGFGIGNNNAAKESKGEYLLLLNSDTLFTYNILDSLSKKLDKYKNLGVYSVSLKNSDGTFQGSGGAFPNLGNLFTWQFAIDDIPFLSRFFNSFHPKSDSTLYQSGLDWVTGAFMVIPKKVYDLVAGFDENIFMYTEEMELAYRIKSHSKQVIYDPTESIIHLGGGSGGSYLALTSEAKYLLYFWRKHKPKWQLPLVRLIIFSGSLLRLLFFGIIKQNDTYKKAYLEALRLCL